MEDWHNFVLITIPLMACMGVPLARSTVIHGERPKRITLAMPVRVLRQHSRGVSQLKLFYRPCPGYFRSDALIHGDVGRQHTFPATRLSLVVFNVDACASFLPRSCIPSFKLMDAKTQYRLTRPSLLSSFIFKYISSAIGL